MKYREMTPERKRELVEQARERAFACEREYGNCPQCVLVGIQEVFGGVDEMVFKSIFGLGAGLGLSSKGMCGALAAVITLIGSSTGRNIADLKQPVDRTCFEITRKVVAKYEAAFGTIQCGKVQESLFGRSFDLLVCEDREAFAAGGGHVDKCTSVVGYCAALAAELIVDGEIEWNGAER